jgi:hypothetical protein
MYASRSATTIRRLRPASFVAFNFSSRMAWKSVDLDTPLTSDASVRVKSKRLTGESPYGEIEGSDRTFANEAKKKAHSGSNQSATQNCILNPSISGVRSTRFINP